MECTIGQLSQKTGVNLETIRYYERIELMPDVPRTAGGHRIYGNDELKRLLFIRRCRKLGFSVDDIRELLHLAHGQNLTCAEVKVITENHLKEIQSRLSDLRKMERTLKKMIRQCDDKANTDCPIIDILST